MKKLLLALTLGAFGLVSARNCGGCRETCSPKPDCCKTVTKEYTVKACPEKVCYWVCPDGYTEA